MRFMSMHKADARMEAGLPPPPEVMTGMWPLIEEMMKAGAFVAGEGLRPSVHGVRLNFVNGRRTVTKGPLVGANELMAGFYLVKVASLDEAIAWASRVADLVGDAEIDVRPVTEAWDIGAIPKPDGIETMRFMLLHKADARSESGAPPSPELAAGMRKLTEEMTAAGVLLAAETLQPSSKGVRLQFAGGTRTAMDGPFTESKEMIAGYSIIEAPSIDLAIHWATRFATLIGDDLEIDIRAMY